MTVEIPEERLAAAEERLVRAEEHAMEVLETLAAGGSALPEPFDGRVDLGEGCVLYVTASAAGYRYVSSMNVGGREMPLELNRGEVLALLASSAEVSR